MTPAYMPNESKQTIHEIQESVPLLQIVKAEPQISEWEGRRITLLVPGQIVRDCLAETETDLVLCDEAIKRTECLGKPLVITMIASVVSFMALGITTIFGKDYCKNDCEYANYTLAGCIASAGAMFAIRGVFLPEIIRNTNAAWDLKDRFELLKNDLSSTQFKQFIANKYLRPNLQAQSIDELHSWREQFEKEHAVEI